MAADDGEGEGSAASAVLTTNGCCDVVVVVVDVSSCKQQPLKPQVRQVLLSNLALAVCLFHNPAFLTLVPSFSLYSLPQQLLLCEMDLIAVVQNGQVPPLGTETSSHHSPSQTPMESRSEPGADSTYLKYICSSSHWLCGRSTL